MKKAIKKKNMLNEAVEFQLLPRLKLMGYMLIILSAGALSYGAFSTVVEEIEDGVSTPLERYEASGIDLSDSPPFELNEREKMQFYTISIIFGSLGMACIIAAKYKKKKLGC